MAVTERESGEHSVLRLIHRDRVDTEPHAGHPNAVIQDHKVFHFTHLFFASTAFRRSFVSLMIKK